MAVNTSIQHLALLSVHTSPLAPMGGKKTGGMNVYIRELAYELGSRGIKVDIFTRRTSHDEPQIDQAIHENVRVIYLTAGGIRPLAPDEIYPHLSEFTARLIAFTTIRNIKYDMIYSHYWLSGWVAQKLKESWGTPFVQMFHTLGHMKKRILNTTDNIFLPDQRSATETEVVQWANRVVAATPAEYTQLLWLYRTNRKIIKIVPPGVNIHRFNPKRTIAPRTQLGLPDNANIFLFVGRIEPLKAVDTIINALATLKSQDNSLMKTVRFVVIGGNPNDEADNEMMRLKSLVAEHGLEEYVIFLGAKDQTALPDYYASATAVIMPSDYESFGMVALEAMASGTPVIASHVGGLAYLVRHEETGFLIPVRESNALADCIKLFIEYPELCDELGNKASQIAQEYAWEQIADRLLTIFDDILVTRRNKLA